MGGLAKRALVIFSACPSLGSASQPSVCSVCKQLLFSVCSSTDFYDVFRTEIVQRGLKKLQQILLEANSSLLHVLTNDDI